MIGIPCLLPAVHNREVRVICLDSCIGGSACDFIFPFPPAVRPKVDYIGFLEVIRGQIFDSIALLDSYPGSFKVEWGWTDMEHHWYVGIFCGVCTRRFWMLTNFDKAKCLWRSYSWEWHLAGVCRALMVVYLHKLLQCLYKDALRVSWRFGGGSGGWGQGHIANFVKDNDDWDLGDVPLLKDADLLRVFTLILLQFKRSVASWICDFL